MVGKTPQDPQEDLFDPTQIRRPDRSLLWYYIFLSLLTGPLFPLTILPLLFKYETLRYKFEDNGVSMSWGFLFRREINLTYRRIQDIHLTRNLLQRWMGLATVSIQTASGSSGPEMSIEGILAADQLRDHLYAQMRGVQGDLEAEPEEKESSLHSMVPEKRLMKHLICCARSVTCCTSWLRRRPNREWPG